MFGKSETQERQIASLTKIMTCLVVFDIMEKLSDSKYS